MHISSDMSNHDTPFKSCCSSGPGTLSSSRVHAFNPVILGCHIFTNPSPLAAQSRGLIESTGTWANNGNLPEGVVGKNKQTQTSYIWIQAAKPCPNLIPEENICASSDRFETQQELVTCRLNLSAADGATTEAREWHSCETPASGPKAHMLPNNARSATSLSLAWSTRSTRRPDDSQADQRLQQGQTSRHKMHLP